MPQPTLIFVPGFKGSLLRDRRSGKIVWLDGINATIGRQSLLFAAELSTELSLLDLEPAGVLERVSVLGSLISQDIYGSTLAALQRQLPDEWRLETFSYDWRRDPVETAGRLGRRVEALAAQGAEVRLLAHSMGAMITAWYLLCGTAPLAEAVPDFRGAAHVSRASLLAGAFRGSTKMFRVMQLGDNAGLNRSLLSAPAICSFDSSYYFLPQDRPFMVDPDSRGVELDLFDAEVWQGQRWGIFGPGQGVRIDADGHLESMQSRLDAGRRFLQVLDSPADGPAGFCCQGISGTGEKTLDRVILTADRALVLNAKQRARIPALRGVSLSADGDGTITAHAGRLPRALAACATEQLTLAQEHMAIVQPGPGLDAAVAFLFADA